MKKIKKYLSDGSCFWPGWVVEKEKWLSYAKSISDSIDPKWFEKKWNNLKTAKPKKIDEIYGEIFALYYIGVIFKCAITNLDPKGKDNHVNDFSFKDQNNINWFVEVKSPSWRGEIAKKIQDEYSKKQKEGLNIHDDCNRLIQQRNSQPQYKNGEGGSFSPEDAIDDAMKKSVKQFAPDRNNLLIVVPNMLPGKPVISLLVMNEGSIVRKIIEKYDTEKIISCVCLINTELQATDGANVEYFSEFISIHKKPDL